MKTKTFKQKFSDFMDALSFAAVAIGAPFLLRPLFLNRKSYYCQHCKQEIKYGQKQCINCKYYFNWKKKIT